MRGDRRAKRFAFLDPPGPFTWLADNEIEWKIGGDGLADFRGLIELIACRHDDQQIDITVRSGLAVGVRTKQIDTVRVESIDQSLNITAYLCFLDHLVCVILNRNPTLSS